MERFADLCKTHYFVIPDNQRGFSWGISQIEDVFRDLVLADTNSHYMGPIILSAEGTTFQDDTKTTTAGFILEDGQQRLTSFFLILAVLRERLVALKGTNDIDVRELEALLFYKKDGLQRRLQNRNKVLDQCLGHFINGVPLALPTPVSPPIVAMQRAVEYLRTRVAAWDEAELIGWKAKIINQAKFVWIDLTQEGLNRYLTFDAINSRGLPLSEFDKIKNFCILVDGVRKLGVGPERQWYDAICALEAYNVGGRAHEEAFIAELYAVFHDEPVSQGQIHNRFVEKYRSLLQASEPGREAAFKDFVSLWGTYAKSFAFVVSPKRRSSYGVLCSANAGKWLDCLDNMGLPTICRPIITASHLRMNQAAFEAVVRDCEIYTFRTYAVVGKRKDANGPSVVQLANEILKNAKDQSYVRRRVCEWLGALAPLSIVLQKLGNGETKYPFDGKNPGWSYCYYFLYEYEVANSPAGVLPLPWGASKEQKVSTLEHILPQTHRDKGWWEAHWPDEHQAEIYKHRLGNLVLTSNNKALGRKPIHEKLADSSGGYSYSHPTATSTEKLIRNYTDGKSWQASNILRREVGMLGFAGKRWAIPCCVDNGTVVLPDVFAEIQASIEVSETDCIENAADDANDEECDEEGMADGT